MERAVLRMDPERRKELSMKLGFIGLGTMGRAMARNLMRAGHTVAAWDRTPARIEELAREGAVSAASPADAARGAEAALSALSDDHAMSAVVLGDHGTAAGVEHEPLIRGLGPGAVHVSLSTISPSFSRRLADTHRAAGQRYVAVPVIGRPEAAAHGELVLLAAGDDDALDFCSPLFAVLGKKTHRLGTHAERANAMKLSANLVMAALIEAFGEAYALAESYGLGAGHVLDVLRESMLSPEAVCAYGERIARGQFEPAGFRLKLGLKDIDLALGAGEEVALPMPFASVLRDRFLVAMARGLEEMDWSAIARILPHRSATA
jgi:3-hydroxyisobutyrate dehydrogenase-like beta-hydroxyacid dehydrogenase